MNIRPIITYWKSNIISPRSYHKMSSLSLSLSARTKTTALKQPKELISYSRDNNGEIRIDDSSLLYFYFPDTEIDKNYDLSHGFKQFKAFEDKGEMDGFLRAIIEHEKHQKKKTKTDVFSFRGLMTKLLTTHYFPDDSIDFNVVFFDGQLFIKQDQRILKAQEEEKEAQILANSTRPPLTKEEKDKFAYVGYKFETLATLPKPWSDCSRAEIEERDTKVVSNAQQYLSVVRTGVGNTKLVLGGEVDCVFDYKPDALSLENKYNSKDNVLSHYVELKTSKTIKHDGQAIQFEKKLFKTWAQCFLLGIPRVFYGFRDEHLILRSIEEFKTEQIPIILKESPYVRHANNPKLRKVNCVDSLKWFGAVLDWIFETIQKENATIGDDLDAQARTVYRLHFNKLKSAMEVLKLDDTEVERIAGEEPVVTREFIEWRKQLNKNEAL